MLAGRPFTSIRWQPLTCCCCWNTYAATMRTRCGPMLHSSRTRQAARVCAALQQPQRNWSIATAVCRVWQTHVSKTQAAVQQAMPQVRPAAAFNPQQLHTLHIRTVVHACTWIAWCSSPCRQLQ
jgi:hypothetical protein